MMPSMQTPQVAEVQAAIYQVFSNARRIQIFWLLMEREMSVNELAEAIDASIQNTSQHLRLMKAEDILVTRRNGQSIYYRIARNERGRYCRAIIRKALQDMPMAATAAGGGTE